MPYRSAGRCLTALVLLLLAACGGGGGDGGDGGSGGGVGPPPPAGTVTVSGTVRFERVPFRAPPGRGLDYANPVLEPSRGVLVRAVRAGSQTVLATGTTSANGTYSLEVPADTSIVVQVVARMLRDTSQPAPRWDVRVQDGRGGSATPYVYSGVAANSSAAGARNIDIPVGINANGVATGTRASGPFAILDTIYTSIQAVLAVEPTAILPPLVIDWGTAPGSYFQAQGNNQWIVLNWDLTEDTEEFDQHVIAHEFGHYLEYNFSRSDSIGGEHALGDRLDPRVAFSEGFGYAFAAYALGDPLLRDSFVNNGVQTDVQNNIETNPSGSTANGGCWCSESSVWSVLWDIHDAANDGADTLSLGFAPLWNAMKAGHASTPAMTTMFSFLQALKSAQPARSAAINALAAAQNVDADDVDDFASSETHAPYANVLPLYSTLLPGTPLEVRSVNTGGRHNKAGNHRFLRYDATSTGTVRLTVTTSNPSPVRDPDFIVYRNGAVVIKGESAPASSETQVFDVIAGQTYIIDAYDCANGCDTEQGTPGNYLLTATIE